MLRPLRDEVRQRLRDALRPRYPAAARTSLLDSFSQAGEDRVVRFLFDVLGISHPSYLDVGAYHPFHLSNTALLHLSGSRGVNVEPDPRGVELFRRHRPEDVTLGVGVGPTSGELAFYRLSNPTLSTFDRDAAEQAVASGAGRIEIVEVLPVPVRTVADVLTELGARPDFLSLDAEGLDRDILRTLPTWPARPVVVCVELLRYAGTLADATREEGLLEDMSELGYDLVADTWVNAVLVDREVLPQALRRA